MSRETNTPPSASVSLESFSKWDCDKMKKHDVEKSSLTTILLESFRRKRPLEALYPSPGLAENKKRAGETYSPQQKTKVITVSNLDDASYQQEPKAKFCSDAVPTAAGGIVAHSPKSAKLEEVKDIVKKEYYEKDSNAAIVSKVDMYMPVNNQFIEWCKQLEELRKYKKLNGDCMVPHHYLPNPRLGAWVR
jgi:hypothetical protein